MLAVIYLCSIHLNNAHLCVWQVPDRHDEVQQRPEFSQRVLQRCAGDEHAVVGVEVHQDFV